MKITEEIEEQIKELSAKLADKLCSTILVGVAGIPDVQGLDTSVFFSNLKENLEAQFDAQTQAMETAMASDDFKRAFAEAQKNALGLGVEQDKNVN